MNSEKLAYKPSELPKLIGLSRTTVYKMIEDGTIPSVRVGHRLIIPAHTLLEWMNKTLNKSL